jgi:cytochrome P450
MRVGFDPVPELGAVRTEQPVVRLEIPGGPSAWLLTRYEDVRATLADTSRFSNGFENLTREGADLFGGLDPGGLGFKDPPDHTRLRRLLTPEFTARRLHRLGPLIEGIIDDHLDAMAEHGSPIDLFASFARPIPSLVVCDLLGVGAEQRDELVRLSDGRFSFNGDAESSLAAIQQSLHYLSTVVAAERVNPGDGLLGMIVREHGDEIDDVELAGLADGLITGGHDTTASMLALGTVYLLQNPALATAVRDRDDQIEAIVTELLRYLTVVQVAFPRFARADMVIAGQPVAAGEMVLCSLSAADRDPVLGSDMDTVDPWRMVASHLAFGHGAHRCIGAPLATMELQAAFPALLRRFPTLRLDVAAPELPWRAFSIVYGVDALPVAW